MVTKRGIQMIKTFQPLSPALRISAPFKSHVQDLLYKRKDGYCVDPEDFAEETNKLDPKLLTSLIINEAKLMSEV